LQPTNLGSLHIPTGASGGQALFAEFFDRMDDYHATRDFPAVKGPSYLGVHLRFGTVSVRRLAAIAMQRMVQGSAGATVWLSELVWREFYFQILANFPHVVGRRSGPTMTPSAGSTANMRSSCSRPGARAAPATRSWTPRWRRSTRPATCTTGCAWWPPVSWSRTWASTGAGASVFRAAPQRLRPVGQQRWLAMGGVQRL
jgi:hypothetical protein